MGISRIETRLEKLFGKTISKICIDFIDYIAQYLPLKVIHFLPKSICSIFASSAVRLNLNYSRCFTWIERSSLSKFSGHKKASFFLKFNYAFRNFSPAAFDNFVQDQVSKYPISHLNHNFYKIWLFHYGGHDLYRKNLSAQLSFLNKSTSPRTNDSIRFLPEHTTNMGHLALLFLYANFYRKKDPQREIVLWPEISPNKLYLDLLLEIFPLKFKFLPGKPDLSKINIHEIDTLTLSQIIPGKWRYEPGSCFPCDQDFPEYLVEPDFKLDNVIELNEFEYDSLSNIGFDKSKWFTILHVKEHFYGYAAGGETRDSSISDYFLSCKLVDQLGGQVIRMGGPNFPRLGPDFPAIDYAHSKIRSERIDYWLWANCRFWVGNGNGASFAIIPFDKPRLVTNVWPINPHGPKNDFYLPKLIYSKNLSRILSPKEMIELKFSRSMKKDHFEANGLKLIDNSKELIQSATKELNNFINAKSNLKELPISDFEDFFISSIGLSKNQSFMNLPKDFENFYKSF